MRYYKLEENGFLAAIGTGPGGTEITETEYNEILAILRSCPRVQGKGYRLKPDLSWEEYDLPEENPDDEEISDEQALQILLGGAT